MTQFAILFFCVFANACDKIDPILRTVPRTEKKKGWAASEAARRKKKPTILLTHDPDAGPGGWLPMASDSTTPDPEVTEKEWMPRWKPGDWWVVQMYSEFSDVVGSKKPNWDGPKRRTYTVKEVEPSTREPVVLVEVRTSFPRKSLQFDLYYEKGRLALTRYVSYRPFGERLVTTGPTDVYNRLHRTLRPVPEVGRGHASPAFPLVPGRRGQTSEKKYLKTGTTENSDSICIQRVRLVSAREWIEIINGAFPRGSTKPMRLADGERVREIGAYILDTSNGWPESQSDCYVVELEKRVGDGERSLRAAALQIWCPGFPWPIFSQSGRSKFYLESHAEGRQR